jgi:hypothetical protein
MLETGYGTFLTCRRTLTMSVHWGRPTYSQTDAFDPKPTSRNAKIPATDSVPLRTNLEPKPKAFARL